MNVMIISMEYKYYKDYECGSFKRNSSVATFSLFFLFFSFLILFFVASMALSIYLSFVFFGIFCLSSFGIFFLCPLWDIFINLRATLYILQEVRRSHTLQ